jgi:hypothetical protein
MSETVTTWLENHPKLLAKLFMVTLLLSQAGGAMAANGGSIN